MRSIDRYLGKGTYFEDNYRQWEREKAIRRHFFPGPPTYAVPHFLALSVGTMCCSRDCLGLGLAE